MFVKAPQPDVANTVRKHFRADAPNLNDGACQYKIFRFCKALTHDTNGDRGVDGPAKLFDCFNERHVFSRFAFYRHDLITGLNTGTESRRTLNRGYHGEKV